MCAFDPGSTNIGRPGPDGTPVGGVYAVTYDDVRIAVALCERLRMGPALGIYEPNALRTTLAWQRAGKLPAGTMVQLYFGGEYGLIATEPGVSFGLMPTASGLLAYLDMLEGHGPALVGVGVGRRPHADTHRTARARTWRPPAHRRRGVLLSGAQSFEQRTHSRGERPLRPRRASTRDVRRYPADARPAKRRRARCSVRTH